MKIRTSLVLAFFLLSVVPLGAIVVYSYYASRRALQAAYQAEGAKLTAQMDRRLTTIREDLERRLAEVSALPNLSQGNVLMTMGDAAPLVESVEIHAQAPEPPHLPMVIQVPHFNVEQRAQLKHISQIGREMSEPNLTPDQRYDLDKRLRDAQSKFQDAMRASQRDIEKSVG